MNLVTLAAAAAVAPALGAQVPFRHLLVAEGGGTSTRPFALHVVEPASRNVTPVRPTGSLSFSSLSSTIALDPADNGALYLNPGLTQVGRLGVQKLTLQGSKVIQRTTPAITSSVGFGARYLVHAGQLYFTSNSTAAAGGLWRAPVAGGQAAQVGTLPGAHDVAVLANRVYAVSYLATATASALLEFDVATTTSRVVTTTLPPTISLGVFGGGLLGGAASGDLLLINVTSGGSTVFLSPNKGPVVAMTQEAGGPPPLFAASSGAGGSVWGINDLQTPVYATPAPIKDVDWGTQDRAWTMTYGAGCRGSNQLASSFAYTGAPTIPNPAFALGTVDGRPASVAVLLLGTGRADVDLAFLGMPGCRLLATPLFQFGLALDANGDGRLPLPIPNDPTMRGLMLQAQQANLDAGANPNGVVTSDAQELGLR
jgi:hypothetical protein